MNGIWKLIVRVGVAAMLGGVAVGLASCTRSQPTSSEAGAAAGRVQVQVVAAGTALSGAERHLAGATTLAGLPLPDVSAGGGKAAVSIEAAVVAAEKAYAQASADLRHAEDALRAGGVGSSASLQKTVATLEAQAKQVAASIAAVQKLVESAGVAIGADINAAVGDLAPGGGPTASVSVGLPAGPAGSGSGRVALGS